jgi:hypothetical protein
MLRAWALIRPGPLKAQVEGKGSAGSALQTELSLFFSVGIFEFESKGIRRVGGVRRYSASEERAARIGS